MTNAIHCMKVFTCREGRARITVEGLLYTSVHQVQRRVCDEIFVETKKCRGAAHVRVSRFAAYASGTQPVGGRNIRRWAEWGRMRGEAVLARFPWVGRASRLLGTSTLRRVDRGGEGVGCQSMQQLTSVSEPQRISYSKAIAAVRGRPQRGSKGSACAEEPVCRSAVKRGGLTALMVMCDVGAVMQQYSSRHAPMTTGKGVVSCDVFM